jgi:hypothetical protein
VTNSIFATSFIFTPVANVIVLETHPKNLTNITKMSRNPAIQLPLNQCEPIRCELSGEVREEQGDACKGTPRPKAKAMIAPARD